MRGARFRVAAQPIAASQSSSATTRFWRKRPHVAVAEFDEATAPANSTIPVAMRAAGSPLRDRSRPLKHIKTQKPAYKHMNFYKCLTALCCARLSQGEAVRRDVWASRPSSDTNACALSAADYSQIFVNAVHGILPGANQ